ncbi:coadhesin-like [Ostrea edulis]|uniref:coadhesin-like n=1 Tax=Ostrea edulis TaxID=37623 RepID=UPI0024AFEEB6|nr:coadhesin-like [Ostrea edulis]
MFFTANGGWSHWGRFGDCSVTCGHGTMIRTRTCTHPAPAHGGADCVGSPTQQYRCVKTHYCPTNGGWSHWGSFGDCSVTCGHGTMIRTRTCTHPAPAHGGADCMGSPTDCNKCVKTHYCPIDGGWSGWSAFGHCSVTCGNGYKTRTRSCSNPAPDHDGADCHGDALNTHICREHHCPINGGWSAWNIWSKCSVTCGTGTIYRSRTCTHPAPEHGGVNCVGQPTEYKECVFHHTRHCPVDGGWSQWSTSSLCTATCGGGTRIRTRTCTQPRPEYGGDQCMGFPNETLRCAQQDCPVDGQWSAWSRYSDCTTTCGVGTKTRYRSCSNPAPLNGGKFCSGLKSEIDQCNIAPCPVDGGWGSWSSYSRCSVTCGVGIQQKQRTCTEPAPAHGGTSCVGESVVSRNCTQVDCPVDGHWGEWSLFGSCSTTCGNGIQTRHRNCSQPAPSRGGMPCTGDSTEAVHCQIKQCPAPTTNKWVTLPSERATVPTTTKWVTLPLDHTRQFVTIKKKRSYQHLNLESGNLK